ncbi:hypothetical protein EMIHUDRAFT_219184 [Emiliania huxleyi CCMP1516]|uniref:LamG-like jellyroll fold domain-containing protein n=2 Tax=Emiliania huxleyi TaxID=2903 RepID=A0A0D3I509_EMIH1|nr:hypothetical protein EMIHUDRAFT_219184 [Emiliania huxleyi CCMP1516]EOD06344.1 hypothetical protein EMIHUDRAFT_219184 [Emiliania huxleyi CCMP1516]|eukprot:XP_005758773.1 hypothetical protein EMIHUDRAFT_219184 [Emiliania huxleyi CCMP1516]
MPELNATEIVIAYAEHGISCTAVAGGWGINPTVSGSTCYYSRSGSSYSEYGGYCFPEVNAATLEEATVAVMAQEYCNGITYEPYNLRYTGRAGTRLFGSSGSRFISWLNELRNLIAEAVSTGQDAVILLAPGAHISYQTGFLGGLEYLAAGFTASGAPYYRDASSSHYIYWDPSCNAFDGTDFYVNAKAPDHIGGSLGLTVAAWVKRSRSGNQGDRLIDFGNGGGSDNIVVAFQYGVAYDVYLGSTQYSFAPSQGPCPATPPSDRWVCGAFPVDVWTHVAVVHKPDETVTMYWDGVPRGSGSLPLPPAVARSGLYVGKSHWGYDPYFRGEMRDVFVFNGALDDGELRELREGSAASQCSLEHCIDSCTEMHPNTTNVEYHCYHPFDCKCYCQSACECMEDVGETSTWARVGKPAVKLLKAVLALEAPSSSVL